MEKNILLILIIMLVGCANNEGEEIPVPPDIKDMPNVHIYTADENPDTVLLKKVNSYGDQPEADLFFRHMGDFTVDQSGRVYITDSAKGEKLIHVFDASGDYLTNLGGEGRGPREFTGLCCLKTTEDELYIRDNQQFKLNVYSIDPIEYSKSFILDLSKFNISGTTKYFSEYYFLSDSTYLIGFVNNPSLETKGEQRFADYYVADENWNIISTKLFEQLLIKEEWGEFQGTPIFQRFPFFKKSIEAVSNQGHIYRALTDDFLIKRYNAEGEYLDAFYYPHQKIEVTRDDARRVANVMTEDIAESMDLPEYWPVLNSIRIDDENRLWITTITESTEKLKWWVLDRTGQLIATFMWPGERAEQAYGLKEDVVIRNGFFYTKEEITETGTDEIVKYRINITGK